MTGQRRNSGAECIHDLDRTKFAENAPDLSGHRNCGQPFGQGLELIDGRQFTVPEQVGHFLEGRMLGQLFNGVPAVAQYATLTIQIADGGRARDDVPQAGRFVWQESPLNVPDHDNETVGTATSKGPAKLASAAVFDGYIYADGASRGNPGAAAAAAILLDGNGDEVGRSQIYLGTDTNNAAEYQGLRLGLLLADQLGKRRIVCRLDSELVVKQMRGEYRIRNPRLRTIAQTVRELCARFDHVEFVHVRRAGNSVADGLANAAIDAYLAAEA